MNTLGMGALHTRTLRLSLCNEVIAQTQTGMSVAQRLLDFERQCRLASTLGYAGLEVAPFTLADNPLQLGEHELEAYRRRAAEHGLVISGLHWLLVQPVGLSLVDADPAVRRRTGQALRTLVRMAAALSAEYLVHGSPKQRTPAPGVAVTTAREWAIEVLREAADEALAQSVVYCLEPLAPAETSFINTIAQAAEVVDAIGSPALCTMIDCSAAGQAESEPIPALIDRWLPTGKLAHVQVNDPNRKAPGQGSLDLGPIMSRLRALNYQGWVAVEPFIYEPDGPGCAEWSMRYLAPMLGPVDALNGPQS